MHHFTRDDIKSLDKRYRAHLVNSLSGFKSANLIGSQNTDNQTNLAIFSSVFHIGASPALVGFVMRPDNGDRHTLDNIKYSKQYIINQVSTEHYKMAHQCSARYPRNESEFSHSGLSTQFIANINAPFVKESRLKYALTLKEIVPITLNNTQIIIGEIIHIICQENSIQPDGYIDIEALETASLSGLDSYHSSIRMARLNYAKPHTPLIPLTVSGSPLSTKK